MIPHNHNHDSLILFDFSKAHDVCRIRPQCANFADCRRHTSVVPDKGIVRIGKNYNQIFYKQTLLCFSNLLGRDEDAKNHQLKNVVTSKESFVRAYFGEFLKKRPCKHTFLVLRNCKFAHRVLLVSIGLLKSKTDVTQQ